MVRCKNSIPGGETYNRKKRIRGVRELDLKGQKITVGEIVANPKAKALLERELNQYMTPMLLKMAKNMSLKEVLRLANGRVPQGEVDRIVRELESV